MKNKKANVYRKKTFIQDERLQNNRRHQFNDWGDTQEKYFLLICKRKSELKSTRLQHLSQIITCVNTIFSMEIKRFLIIFVNFYFLFFFHCPHLTVRG